MLTGISDILIIEAKAILEGLKLARDRGFRQTKIECDNTMPIDGLRNDLVAESSIGEVRLIHEWRKKDWQIKFHHIPRDNNRIADQLVKSGGNKLIV